MKGTLNMQQPAPAPKPLHAQCGKNVSCKVADCTQTHAGVGATAALRPRLHCTPQGARRAGLMYQNTLQRLSRLRNQLLKQ